MDALADVKVLELGQLIAGPFAGRMLADFGADVIKVENARGGDPLRRWRVLRGESSLWWEAQSRNKRSVTLDLRDEADRATALALAAEADVVIENFTPGRLESWGLGWETLRERNPDLVMLRISGYGQSGPYADRPGFGVVGEAMGGLRHLTGEPGRTPVRCGVSIGDSLAAMHGLFGVLAALRHAERTGEGQVVDVALYESVFNLMESLLPEYTEAGIVREATGSTLPGIAPTNAYRCGDGTLILVAGNGDRIFRDLMRLIGREDLAEDPALARNDGRAERADELDRVIGEWTAARTGEEALEALAGAKVPSGRVYTARDIAEDPHYRARGMLVETETVAGDPITLPGIVPRLSATPGRIRTPAPALGQHDATVRGATSWPARGDDGGGGGSDGGGGAAPATGVAEGSA